jgi:hypothetical protein
MRDRPNSAERSVSEGGDLPEEYETIISFAREDHVLEARGRGDTWLYAEKDSLMPTEPAFATGDEKGDMNDLDDI